MRSTTEYEVQLYKTRVRPSTRYDVVRGTIILEKYDKYKYQVRVKTELVRVRFKKYEDVLLRDRTDTRSHA